MQFVIFVTSSPTLPYVLRVVWLLWSTANLFKCSNGLWLATTTTAGEPSLFWDGCKLETPMD